MRWRGTVEDINVYSAIEPNPCRRLIIRDMEMYRCFFGLVSVGTYIYDLDCTLSSSLSLVTVVTSILRLVSGERVVIRNIIYHIYTTTGCPIMGAKNYL